MRSEFRGDFNQVSVGDVIRPDSSVYLYRKEGQIMHIGQQGNQNDSSEFQREKNEVGFVVADNLGHSIFAITGFYAQEDMRANRELRDEGRDAEYGQFIGQEVIGDTTVGFDFKEQGRLISFNQGPHDIRGGFDVFEHTFNFPRPRLATVQFKVVKTIASFTPA